MTVALHAAAEEPPPDYVFTTLRYDPMLRDCPNNMSLAGSFPESGALYMFRYHVDRLQTALSWVGRQCPAKTITQETIREVIQRLPNEENALRLRITFDLESGLASIISAPTPVLALHNLFPKSLDIEMQPEPAVKYELYICPHSTKPSLQTRHKTSDRDVYNAARLACGLTAQPTADPVEVLLWNPAGELMEGSLTSVYVRRQGRWVTPHLDCGGNDGTTRRWALETALCSEGIVKIDGDDGLKEGELAWISNGLRGFIQGTVRRGYYDQNLTVR